MFAINLRLRLVEKKNKPERNYHIRALKNLSHWAVSQFKCAHKFAGINLTKCVVFDRKLVWFNVDIINKITCHIIALTLSFHIRLYFGFYRKLPIVSQWLLHSFLFISKNFEIKVTKQQKPSQFWARIFWLLVSLHNKYSQR